jgi:hypothetical protein
MKTGPELTIRKNKVSYWSFWAMAILCLFLANAPVVGWFLSPVTQFTTMIHELGHAVVCMATGGHVDGLTIVSDGQGHGGLTNCIGGNAFLYAQSGYLGTAVFGSFLIFLCQFRALSKATLCALGGSFALATLALIGANVLHTGWQGFFSFLWGMVMSGLLIWAGIKWKPATANALVLFLAVQTALNSVTSLFDLTRFSMGGMSTFSDATNMQSMTGVPALVWALFWALCSVALVGFTVWRTYGFQARKP